MKNKKKNPMGMWWRNMGNRVVPSKKKYTRKDRKNNNVNPQMYL